MKPELSDHNHPTTMFPKFPPPPPHPFHFTSHGAAVPTHQPPPKPAQAEDGGETIQVPRRPRGRPPGSKNKPKPPLLITRQPDAPPMAPHIIEVPSGADVVDSLARLARRRGIGLCALSASGFVSDVTLRQPGAGAGSGGAEPVVFHGRLELGSLAGVLLQEGQNGNLAPSGEFSVSLWVPQGRIVGGKVAGPLVAAGTVYVVATSFDNPTYHRLPLEDEEGDRVGSPAAGGAGAVWAPTARLPEEHPPPPPF